ncbi:MAG: hypothetical protein NXI32_09285 [bacterium]|nr:hypothetical protein [bacterium]
MALTPAFNFGRIRGVISANFPLSRGVSPSVCSVTIPPISGLDRAPQPMIFSDGFRTVAFRDCIISDVSPSVDQSGFETWTVSILDRRWRWKFGQISGTYNIRRGDSIITSTMRSPRQLAALCFEAMGEKRFDVSRMPNDTYPFVDWDVERPDAALDQLCQMVGAHVALRVDDVPAIYQDGIGFDLPNIPSSSASKGFNFGVVPGKVGVLSAPFEWQMDFKLLPVGQDVDGTIKDIYKLSYAPKPKQIAKQKLTGWLFSHPDVMQGVPERVRKYAEKSVWKWFKIVKPDIEVMPMTNIPLHSTRQLVFLDHQLDFEHLEIEQRVARKNGWFDMTGRVRRRPEVFGKFSDNGDNNIDGTFKESEFPAGNDQSRNATLLYPKAFDLDSDRGLVKFGDPVYMENPVTQADRGKEQPTIMIPDIRLRVAVNLRSPTTQALYRAVMTKAVPGANDLRTINYETREDIQPRYTLTAEGGEHNLPEVRQQLAYYANFAAYQYQLKNPGSGTYPQVIPASPDGRLAQVVWSIDSEGFISTSIYRDIEGLLNIVDYDERRREVARLATQKKLTRQFSQQDRKKDPK